MAFNPLPDLPHPVQFSEMGDSFSQSGVYFLWFQGAVVYVGQARNVTKRILRHAVEGVKVFDEVSFKPCVALGLLKTEKFFIEALLPKYNRCSFSECIRRIWVGHMDVRPLPNREVSPGVAAAILGVTPDVLKLLHAHGLTPIVRRRPRTRARRICYVVSELHQFTAQHAAVIIAVRQEAAG